MRGRGGERNERTTSSSVLFWLVMFLNLALLGCLLPSLITARTRRYDSRPPCYICGEPMTNSSVKTCSGVP